MNYRHSFHAGNFADVLKHALLARILAYLALKPAAFRVIDTHAGSGLYDLASEEAGRTAEWRDGIARLDASLLDVASEEILAPYRAAIAATRAFHGSTFYPGSPWIIQHMLRREDRLIAAELHPKTFTALTQTLGRDRRCKALALDGWVALRANVPPKERRGLVLIDPPFEKTDEFDTFATELIAAHAKWPTGIYMCWFPLKDPAAADLFINRLVDAGLARILRLELSVDRSIRTGGLSATGLIVINPPWTLEQDANVLLPALAARLAQGQDPRYRCLAIAADG
jgi:23S rRNA (adenine2030-N6)-methyltransferase